MAKQKSSSSETETDNAEDSVASEDTIAADDSSEEITSEAVAEETEAGVEDAEASDPTEDTPADDAAIEASAHDAETAVEETSEDAAAEDSVEDRTEEAEAAVEGAEIDTSESAEDSAPVATSSTMEPPQVVQRGPGFVPLALGGIVAGAIGFGAGYFFDLNAGGQVADLSGSVETQGAEIASLSEQAAALETSIANLAPPEVDLSGIETAISDLGGRLDGVDGNISDLASRLTEVEARPVFTGEAGADEAAIAAAIDQLRDDLIAQQEENAILAEDIQSMADDAASRIAEAEARAEASANTATAQAALSQLRIAIASGSPFAEPLAEVAEAQGLEVPDAVAAVSETGVPTLAEIEAAFPAAARAALPVALQANAGETAGDRLGAFLRSQVGGRALDPQPGDDPDAVLSRAGAAISSGDLTTALEELTALPDPALDVMGDWISLAASRISALEALDGLAGALGN